MSRAVGITDFFVSIAIKMLFGVNSKGILWFTWNSESDSYTLGKTCFISEQWDSLNFYFHWIWFMILVYGFKKTSTLLYTENYKTTNNKWRKLWRGRGVRGCWVFSPSWNFLKLAEIWEMLSLTWTYNVAPKNCHQQRLITLQTGSLAPCDEIGSRLILFRWCSFL